MERLTKRITQYTIELSASANPIQYNGSSQRVHIKHPFWNVFDRLCKYEDAEENGMLIHLPCRVGDTVYALTPFCEICEEALDNEYACENCSRGHFITETKFDYEMIPMVGKRIFLTEAEAEQALKQMGE